MPANYSKRQGFTLLEVLVATAVLVVLVTLVSQLVKGVSVATLSSRKRLDADAASRMALGVMSNDFAKMVRRPMAEVDYLFSKNPGNDRFFFYSEAPGYSATPQSKGSVSLVGYQINSQFQLQRLGKALPLSGTGSLILLSGSSNQLASLFSATLSGTDDFQVISDEIFRLEFCFLRKDGLYFEPSQAWKPWGDDDNDGIPNIKDVRAVVVTVVCLDKTSRKLVRDMQALANLFPDSGLSSATTDPSKLAAAIWKKQIEGTPSLASKADIPQTAASAIRVYQRLFFLDNL